MIDGPLDPELLPPPTSHTEQENEAIAFALRLVLGDHGMVDAAIKMAQSAWKGRNIGQPK